jgi:ribokinase
MKMEVVGFGALNMDKLHQVNKIAHPDEEVYITGLTESCGGSAANTIIGLSKLGIKTGFIGKVATDREGKLLIKNLQDEGVDTHNVIISKKGRSGSVNGYVDKNGERALYVDPGVNDYIMEQEIDTDKFKGVKVLHLTSFVGNKTDKSIKAQQVLLNDIEDSVCVSFDPGRLYINQGKNFLDKYLTNTDILMINQAEINQLTDKEKSTHKMSVDELRTEVYDNVMKIKSEYGIGIVVVKMGDNGSYVSDDSESHFTNAFKVSCVDTTGAGDAYNSGFLYGYIKGEDIKKSAMMGNYIASKCVSKHGATSGLPDTSKQEDKILDDIINML